MKKIRVGIFETNSSSSHSFVKSNKKTEKTVDQLKQGRIVLGTGQYGWGYEELTTWLEKADYLAIEANEEEEKRNKLLKILNLKYPNCEFIILGALSDDEKEREELDCGYIDHQSYGEIWEKLTDMDSIYELIFGTGKIIIDNDNH